MTLSNKELAEQLYNSYYDNIIEIEITVVPFLECQEYVQKRWIMYAETIKKLDIGVPTEISESPCKGCKWEDNNTIQLTNKYVLCPFCTRYYQDRYKSGD